ncbi:hypothetical protein AB1K32_15200 [Metabacillus dongyingensis]|uniref:hypothetical protein n=1 Tax=Metabacillus dongyingensis TaxID=2874282 RepID=UPI003B8AD8BC
MSQLTKVSSHRKGYVKFGTRPYKDDWDPTVKVSYLTPEQLEAYKSKGEVQMSDVKTKSVEEYNSLLKQFEDRGDLVNELQEMVDNYKVQVKEKNSEINELTAKNKRIETAYEDYIIQSKMENGRVQRELMIAEENLTASNKSLRGREADIENLERELSYARENEKNAKGNNELFRAVLKAVL